MGNKMSYASLVRILFCLLSKFIFEVVYNYSTEKLKIEIK